MAPRGASETGNPLLLPPGPLTTLPESEGA